MLLSGAPEQALDQLEDPCLAGVPEAERLLATVLDLVCREACRVQQQGDEREAARCFARVARHDPERAALWRRRLVESRGAPASLPAAGSGVLTALEGLLSELRDERSRSSRGAGRSSQGSLSSRLRSAASAVVAGDSEPHVPFLLSAPGLAECEVLLGPEVRLEGREEPGGAALGELRSLLSFHGGPGWLYLPPGGCEVELAGAVVPEEGVELLDGDELRLASGVALVFRAPVAASGTALLLGPPRPGGGAPRRIVLMSSLAEHPLCLAAHGGHLEVPGLTHPARLSLSEGRLQLECSLAAQQISEPCATPTAVELPLDAPAELPFCTPSRGETSPFALNLRPLGPHSE